MTTDVLTLWISVAALAVAVVGIGLACFAVRYAREQVSLMREEQRARVVSEGALINTGEGTMWVGGPLGRLIHDAPHRLWVPSEARPTLSDLE